MTFAALEWLADGAFAADVLELAPIALLPFARDPRALLRDLEERADGLSKAREAQLLSKFRQQIQRRKRGES